MSDMSPATRESRPGWLRILLPIVIAGVVLCLVALGTWQVQRLFWKLELIERIETRIHADPVTPPAPGVEISRDAHEYLRVHLTGTYLPQAEAMTYALTERGAGNWVMTPMRTTDGTIIYVNRGFVPAGDAPHPPAAGTVTVTGLLRLPEPDGIFLRPNVPEDDRWFSRDIATLARRSGLPDAAPYFIDAEANSDAPAPPVAGMTQVRFSNNHLVYALTWYGLAALLVGMSLHVRRRSIGPKSARRFSDQSDA